MPQPPLDNGKRTKGRQRRENYCLVENKEARQVTFSKRKAGLWKKACEIAVLCGVKIALVVISEAGKAFAFGSPSVDAVLDLIDDAPGAHAHPADADEVEQEALEALYRETDEKGLEVVKEAARLMAIGEKVLELQKQAGKQSWIQVDVDALGMEELPVFVKSLERIRDNVRRHVDNLLAAQAP